MNDPILNFSFDHDETIELVPTFGYYANSRLGISLVDNETGEPFTTVTVNIPEAHLNDGEVAIKDWSENQIIVQVLISAGWLIDTGRELSSGHVFPKIMRVAGPLAVAVDAFINTTA